MTYHHTTLSTAEHFRFLRSLSRRVEYVVNTILLLWRISKSSILSFPLYWYTLKLPGKQCSSIYVNQSEYTESGHAIRVVFLTKSLQGFSVTLPSSSFTTLSDQLKIRDSTSYPNLIHLWKFLPTKLDKFLKPNHSNCLRKTHHSPPSKIEVNLLISPFQPTKKEPLSDVDKVELLWHVWGLPELPTFLGYGQTTCPKFHSWHHHHHQLETTSTHYQKNTTSRSEWAFQ